MSAFGQTLPPGRDVENTPTAPILRFLSGQPKALGTVQIIIGVVTVLFGIVLVSDPPFAPISVISGNVYWAPIAYIIAGSLSVAAENNLHPCVVQGSLGMNVVSALFSAVGISVLIADFFLYYSCYPYEDCNRFEVRSKAISGVLLIFTFLQFIISICISAFACKATCCSQPMVHTVTYANQVPAATIANQVPFVIKGNPQDVVYIPQTQVNMNNHTPPNMYQWPHSR